MDKTIFTQKADYGELVCAISAMISKAIMDYFLAEEVHKDFVETLMLVKMGRQMKEGEHDDDI